MKGVDFPDTFYCLQIDLSCFEWLIYAQRIKSKSKRLMRCRSFISVDAPSTFRGEPYSSDKEMHTADWNTSPACKRERPNTFHAIQYFHSRFDVQIMPALPRIDYFLMLSTHLDESRWSAMRGAAKRVLNCVKSFYRKLACYGSRVCRASTAG